MKRREPFKKPGARRAALLIAKVDDFGDLNRLRDAIDARRKVMLRLSRERECAEAMDRVEAAGPGSMWMKSFRVSGGPIPPGSLLTLRQVHRGRKHVGAWFHVDGQERNLWLSELELQYLDPYDHATDTPEKRAERELHARSERSFEAAVMECFSIPAKAARR